MTSENIHKSGSGCPACGADPVREQPDEMRTAGPSCAVIVPGDERVRVVHMIYDPTPEIDNLKRSVELIRLAVESVVSPDLMKQIDAKVIEYLSVMD